jgi:V8-like Glu-specific endopeptidase
MEVTPQFATLVGAIIALIGALAGHYVSRINAATSAAKDVDVKKLEVENTYKLETAKHEHEVELEAQKFVRDIIAKTLETGTTEEQTRNLKAYAKINLIGSPYKEALLNLPDQELPSIDTEKVIGQSSDNVNPFELENFLKSSRAVGRVVIKLEDMKMGLGTGFLISDRVLMTIYHVLPSKEYAQDGVVEFGYESDEGGRLRMPEAFSLDPQTLFLSSDKFRYSIVAVQPQSKAGEALSRFGSVNLSRSGKISVGDVISIVHHPTGVQKKMIFRGGSVIAATATVVHYGIFTEPGSGGAPIFNDRSEVIAVHSGFVPAKDREGRLLNEKGTATDEIIDPISIRKAAKEGYSVEGMLADLASAAARLSPAQQAILQPILSK